MMIIGYKERNNIESVIKNFFINFADDRLDRYWTVICYVKFIFIFKYGQYFSSSERLTNFKNLCTTRKRSVRALFTTAQQPHSRNIFLSQKILRLDKLFNHQVGILRILRSKGGSE